MRASVCAATRTCFWDISALRQDLAVDQDRKPSSTKAIHGLLSDLRVRQTADAASIHPCFPERLYQACDMIKIDTKDQSRSSICASVKICAHHELVDFGRVDPGSKGGRLVVTELVEFDLV